jgi:G:T-mismatch repair DNA endonuclease (very short patch repair protein)
MKAKVENDWSYAERHKAYKQNKEKLIEKLEHDIERDKRILEKLKKERKN